MSLKEKFVKYFLSSMQISIYKITVVLWIPSPWFDFQTDLAVHKKKIAEVEEWLKRHIQQRQRASGQVHIYFENI